MDKHSKHCISSQVQVFIKFILNLKNWNSKEPDLDRSGILHLTCLLQQSMGHGEAGKEDSERSAQSISEEVVTVKLHQTKPTTTAVVVAHKLPYKPLTKPGSKTWGLCDALRRMLTSTPHQPRKAQEQHSPATKM